MLPLTCWIAFWSVAGTFLAMRFSSSTRFTCAWFARKVVVRERFGDVCYVVAGAGPLEEALRAKAKALGLEASVCFAGLVRNLPFGSALAP